MAKNPKIKQANKLKTPKCYSHSGCGGAFYGLGFLGSAIYYITTATSFWGGVFGVIKSIIWPAFLIFELMKYLGM